MTNDMPHKNILIFLKTLTKKPRCGKNKGFRHDRKPVSELIPHPLW